MIIDGKKIAQKILEEVEKKIEKRGSLRLAAILVGANPGLKKFIELKKKAAEEVGIEFKVYEFSESISNSELRKEINKICKASVNHGVIIELPLPKHLNTQYLLNAIPEEKDVDVLSQKSQGAFFAGRSKILPPAVEAVKQIFEEYKLEPRGKIAAVFGYGLLVGKPISHWLAQEGAAVSIITEYATRPEKFSKEADIIVSGIGKPKIITAEMVKEGAVVIDFGFNASIEEGKSSISGDVEFEAVSQKAGLITPVPGGVGPIVIASVLKNLLELNA